MQILSGVKVQGFPSTLCLGLTTTACRDKKQLITKNAFFIDVLNNYITIKHAILWKISWEASGWLNTNKRKCPRSDYLFMAAWPTFSLHLWQVNKCNSMSIKRINNSKITKKSCFVLKLTGLNMLFTFLVNFPKKWKKRKKIEVCTKVDNTQTVDGFGNNIEVEQFQRKHFLQCKCNC